MDDIGRKGKESPRRAWMTHHGGPVTRCQTPRDSGASYVKRLEFSLPYSAPLKVEKVLRFVLDGVPLIIHLLI